MTTIDFSDLAPAFIPHPDDEHHEMDTLGMFQWGMVRGEWSGTTCWLADAPLPADGIVESLVRDLPDAALALVRRICGDVGTGLTTPVVLLAPVDDGGTVLLPVQDYDIAVNPNYIAHIQRTIPGGAWHASQPHAWEDGSFRRVLVYVVDCEARGIVTPLRKREGT